MSANTDTDDPDVHDIISCEVFFMKNGRKEVYFCERKKKWGATSTEG